MGANIRLVAKTLFGFEELLAAELKQLGALNIQMGNRMVSFEGDLGFIYKANLASRTAIKILKPIYQFKAKNEQQLYDGVRQVTWNAYLSVDQTLAIDASVSSDFFTHSKYVALKTKDAIVDQFRDALGQRPDVDTEDPDLRVNIHIYEDQCTLSLDSSGNSLHQRGYRTVTNIAPINEVLAAGLLLLSGWQGQCHFLDPMCGSGTIAIEAAMIACNIPANINRPSFAFEKWPDWDENLFSKIRESLLSKTKDFPFQIHAQDLDMSAVKKTKINVVNANLADFVEIKHYDFFSSKKTVEGKLHILFNPPYDERIGIQTETFYQQIGNTLKRHYPGTDAWLVTANVEGLKSLGLKPSKKIKVYNGALEGRLVKYEMYEGSKRHGG